MVILRWTGKGWLSYVVIVASLAVGALAASPLRGLLPEVGGRNPGFVIVWFLVVAALAPAHWLLGRMLNSRPGPRGREWFDEHTAFGVPVETVTYAQASLGLAVAVFVVGQLAAPWGGAALVLTVVVAVFWIRGRRRHARLVGAVADRERLAQTQGWRYVPRDKTIALRWKESYGRKAAYTMTSFGVLAGDLGLPFTLFSTQDVDKEIETVAVVHLPVNYPNVQVDARAPYVAVTPEEFNAVFAATSSEDLGPVAAKAARRLQLDPDLVRATPDDTPFSRDLLSPDVRRTTAQHGLVRWWVQGRDVLCASHHGGATPPTAEEAIALVRSLVELAHAFPPGLAEQYGAPPATDLPYR